MSRGWLASLIVVLAWSIAPAPPAAAQGPAPPIDGTYRGVRADTDLVPEVATFEVRADEVVYGDIHWGHLSCEPNVPDDASHSLAVAEVEWDSRPLSPPELPNEVDPADLDPIDPPVPIVDDGFSVSEADANGVRMLTGRFDGAELTGTIREDRTDASGRQCSTGTLEWTATSTGVSPPAPPSTSCLAARRRLARARARLTSLRRDHAGALAIDRARARVSAARDEIRAACGRHVRPPS